MGVPEIVGGCSRMGHQRFWKYGMARVLSMHLNSMGLPVNASLGYLRC